LEAEEEAKLKHPARPIVLITFFYAAVAEFSLALGEHKTAINAFEHAHAVARSPAERCFYDRKLQQIIRATHISVTEVRNFSTRIGSRTCPPSIAVLSAARTLTPAPFWRGHDRNIFYCWRCAAYRRWLAQARILVVFGDRGI